MKQFLLLLLLAPLFTFGQWTQIGSEIDGVAADDQSGLSVSVSGDGSIVAIGSPQKFASSNPGHVRVFNNSGGVWSQRGLTINGEGSGDQFGFPVSISSDGSVLAVGAAYNDGNGTDSGHVRVFEWTGSAWSQIGPDIDGELFEDQSGTSISLSGDGNTLAIGAIYNDGETVSNVGHVRVFARSGNIWTKVGLDLDGDATWDSFGGSVSLNNDGSVLAIGGLTNDTNGSNSGHVRVFAWTGSAWSQVGSDILGESVDDYTGRSVSLNSDGTVLAIGADGDDTNGSNAGYVRVFEWNGSSWTQVGLNINGEAAGDLSGTSISLSSDGSILAIGALSNDGNGNNSGHARVYENLAGTWTQVSLDIDGEAAVDKLGISVSLSSNGSVLAIGAHGNDNNGTDSGHVRVFNNALLSVTSNSFGPQFRAQPNPSFGTTNIELGSLYQEVKVSIFDLLGKAVMNKTYNNTNKIILDTQQFTTGVYVVKVESNTNRASLKLVIK